MLLQLFVGNLTRTPLSQITNGMDQTWNFNFSLIFGQHSFFVNNVKWYSFSCSCGCFFTVITPDPVSPNRASVNRKVRRIYLDKRKCNESENIENSNSNLSTSEIRLSILKDKENTTAHRYALRSSRSTPTTINQISSLNNIGSGMCFKF